MNQNRVVLTGKFVERDPLRFTPAGIPALNFRVAHDSEQQEAGLPRKILLEIACVALGTAAESLSRATPEGQYRFEGFLAMRNRHSRQPTFHVTQFEIART